MCGPICAIGIGGGLWLANYLGINELTLGLWIGALIISLASQFNKFLIKKNKAFPFSFIIILIVFWFLSFFPIWSKVGWQEKTRYFCGLPRVVFGSFLGMFVLYFSDWLNNKFLEKFHQNKVYFPYQRVIIPIIILIITSIVVEIFLC